MEMFNHNSQRFKLNMIFKYFLKFVFKNVETLNFNEIELSYENIFQLSNHKQICESIRTKLEALLRHYSNCPGYLSFLFSFKKSKKFLFNKLSYIQKLSWQIKFSFKVKKARGLLYQSMALKDILQWTVKNQDHLLASINQLYFQEFRQLKSYFFGLLCSESIFCSQFN